jgi:hypothetical protein
MPAYLITNRVPDGFTPSAEAFAAWTAWFESLGDGSPTAGTRPSPAPRPGTAAPAPRWVATR